METTSNTFVADQAPTSESEFRALQAVIAALQPLSAEAQQRIHDAAATFLKIGSPRTTHGSRPYPSSGAAHPSYSQDAKMTPKEFMLEKHPKTDVERVACLAYYLSHYRATPHFKTLELSKLNTEAAQPKFANAANATNNAVKRGYLVPAVKGQRQLSAAGEQFVRALPDRDAARNAMTAIKPRRRSSKPRLGSDEDVEGGDST